MKRGASETVTARAAKRTKKKQELQQKARTLFSRVPTNAPKTHYDELKYLDVAYGVAVADTTGTVTLLNGVAVGDTAITREGRQTYWKSVEVHGILQQVDNSMVICRCDLYIMYDQQPGAAVPGMTDFFVESVAGSPHNLSYRERFKTLCHWSGTLGPRVETATQAVCGTPCVLPVDIYKKLNIRTTYKGDTNAIGDIATGAIYIVTIGTAGANNGGSFYITTRMRFSER